MSMSAAETEFLQKVSVLGGNRLTFDQLPDEGTTRWVARRKAEVVAAVESGLLTTSEACDRYDLSLEEFVSWQRAADRNGTAGLRMKMIQQNRLADGRQNRRRSA
jgi:hypothetical protein